MVRNYKKKGNKGNTPEDIIYMALQDIIRNRTSLREAANNFGVKKSTLYDRLQKYRITDQGTDDSGVEEESTVVDDLADIKSKYATRKVFTTKEEHELQDYLVQCSNYNYGLGYKAVRKLAYEFAKGLGKSILLLGILMQWPEKTG